MKIKMKMKHVLDNVWTCFGYVFWGMCWKGVKKG